MEGANLDSVRALLADGRGGQALALLARLSGSAAALPDRELASLIEPTLAEPCAMKRCYADLFDAGAPRKEPIRAAARALGELRLHRAALALLGLTLDEHDVESARDRARWHLALGELDSALRAADDALSGMLRTRMTVERFVQQAATREPEELLRFTRAEIARMPELREAIVVRWQALRRSGRKSEASAMRELCLRYWPERVSVWEEAGNHALDDVEPDRALEYFARALERDPTSTVAMAGKAIAHEMRKDWSAALECRREVAVLEDAFERDDAASLHRVLRYAANLARLGRWMEASSHFHRAVQRGAFEKAPQERPALLRVFGRELYAPSVMARFASTWGGIAETPATRMALGDAVLLQRLADAVAQQTRTPHERALALGMCALQAGDPAAAYRAFDAADEACGDDMVTHHLLCSSALELGARDAVSIAGFARGIAQRELESAASGERRFYAALTLARVGDSRALQVGMDEPFAALLRGLDGASVELAALARVAEHWCARLADSTALAPLRAWTALREACIARGAPPGLAVLACARMRARAAS